MSVYMMYVLGQGTCPRPTCEVWVLGIKSGSTGLVASPFTHRALLPPLALYFLSVNNTAVKTLKTVLARPE